MKWGWVNCAKSIGWLVLLFLPYQVSAQSIAVSIDGSGFQTKTSGAAVGSGWLLNENGSISSNVNISSGGSYKFQIKAYGDSVAGVGPTMELRVDQKLIKRFNVNSKTAKIYSASSNLSAGSHQIAIAFTNDYYARGQDRNLYVAHLDVLGVGTGTTPIPSPTPGSGSTPPAPAPAPSPGAPSITSGPTVSNVTSTTATITWSLSEPSTGQVEYGTTSSYGKMSILENSYNYSTHIQKLSALAAGTTYHYRVISKNTSGAQVVSSGKTFTTAASSSTPEPTPTSEDPAPAQAPSPGSSSGPRGQDANAWTLTFSDEFENGYDTSKWNDHVWYKSPSPVKNYAVENGSLKIWPQQAPDGSFPERIIDTDGKFYQTYGFFEIEAKLPVGRGVWPAFWLYNHDYDDPFRPEIDIMEAYSGGGPGSGWSDANLHPTAYAPTIWVGDPGDQGGTKMLENLGDLSAGFHTYALKWEANRQTFYFDGREVYSVTVTMPNRMYVMLDILYGSASGTPNAQETPQGKGNSFEVRYVRVWKKK